MQSGPSLLAPEAEFTAISVFVVSVCAMERGDSWEEGRLWVMTRVSPAFEKTCHLLSALTREGDKVVGKIKEITGENIPMGHFFNHFFPSDLSIK